MNLLRKAWLPWVGIAIVAVLWGGYFLKTRGDRLVPLTSINLEEAKAKWKSKGMADYTFDVSVSGVQSERHHIVVRSGKVVSMSTNGKPDPEHIWAYWTVDGMFGFLEEDLLASAHPQSAFQTDDPSKVYLSVRFDPVLGYATKYLRQVFGRDLTIEWNVDTFFNDQK